LYGVYKKRVRKQQKFIIRNCVYFVDIYMKAYKVAIEVDGGYHNSPQQIEKDKQKDLDLSTLGLLVIRVKNEDVRKRFGFIKNILEKRHSDIIKGVKVSTGTMRI
jgi:uroporphyrinogen-III synthase